jgi:ATP-dependent protease ClpP protease subunit
MSKEKAKDDLLDLNSPDDYVRIAKIERKSTEHIIDLHSGFPSPKEFSEVFTILDTLGEFDKLTFKIGSNYGGSLETGVKLINNIMTVQVPVKLVVDSTVYSMAALFVCALLNLGHEVHLMPNIFLMFHDYSGFHIGKGGEMKTAIEHERQWTKDMLTTYCHPFLTKGEINKMVNGQDFYISQKDAIARIGKLVDRKSTKAKKK